MFNLGFKLITHSSIVQSWLKLTWLLIKHIYIRITYLPFPPSHSSTKGKNANINKPM
jgi:hypothetical protein